MTGTVSLLRLRARALALAPQGRPWVTYSGRPGLDDDRVQVLSAAGTVLSSLRTCRKPDAGIAFATGRAFVACSENGLGGSIDVVDLESLEHRKTIAIAPPAGGASIGSPAGVRRSASARRA